MASEIVSKIYGELLNELKANLPSVEEMEAELAKLEMKDNSMELGYGE